MKRLLLVFVPVVALVMGADSPKDTKTAPAALKVTASELSWTYRANEIRGDDLYNGKTLEVRGWLGRVMKKKDDLSRPNFGAYIVGLWPSELRQETMVPVECYFHERERKQLAKLDGRRQMTVVGTCRGLFDSGVALEDCKIVAVSDKKPTDASSRPTGYDRGQPVQTDRIGPTK